MPVILDAPRLGLEHPRFVGWGRKAWVDGEAILARDRLSGLPVAWSSFPKTSAGGWRSFTDLAPSLGRDLHPGLARLIGYGREERSAWIAEEWIPGTTSLADRERAASLASRDLRGLLLQFAAALAALHAAGLVHGRLTPAHLRFTRAAGRLGHGWIVGAGTAWLGHPGSSRALDEAPELAAGEVPTPRSDVYALGATFLAALASPIDEPWRAFLDRLAQADPADRPADGQAVIQLARAIPRRIAARGARASAGEQAESGVTPAPVGRAPEHLLALAWLERARRGEVHALEVRGPSGSGKSTFLAAVAAAARRRGFEVLALDLRPGSTSDPEATVLEALERALGGGSAFASALATLPPTALPEQRCALLATRLGEALDRTGARLCLVVDPIAGSDQEGLPLLRYLAGEIGPRPFLVLAGTIAPGQFPLAEVIELPPLDLRATGQLLARLLAEGSVPPDLGPVLHAAAGGHPLAMRLALAGWLAEGRLAIGSEAWIERPTAVRSTGERDPIVSAALARLDPRSRAAAELLAIWNGALPVPVQNQLWPERAPVLPDWLAARSARGELALASESGRAALLAEMSAEERATNQRRLFLAIGHEPGPLGEAFASLAVDAGEAAAGAVAALTAARTARASGRSAAALGHYRQALAAAARAPRAIDVTTAAYEALGLAVALGEWAAAIAALGAIDAAGEIGRRPAEIQFELALQRSQVMREFRRIDESTAACSHAAHLAREHPALGPVAGARVELEQAAVDFVTGRPTAGIQRLDRILPQLIAAGRKDLQAVALHRRAILQSQAGETRPALRSALAAIRAARRLPEAPETQLRALTSAAFLACLAGRPAPALRYLAAARTILAASPHTALQVTELTHRAEALVARGAFAAAEEALLEARRVRLRSSGRGRLPAILIALGSVRFRSGRLAAAAQAYEEAIGLAEELLLPEVHSARGNLGLLLVRLGEQREGERLIRLGLADPRPDRRALGRLNLAQCLRQTGRLWEAASELETALAELSAHHPAVRRLLAERARLRHAAGDSRGALAELRALGAPSPDPEARAEEQLTIALAEAALGNDAGPAFVQAVTLARGAFDPTFRAEVVLEALAWANTAAASEEQGQLIGPWLAELGAAAAATDAPLPSAWLTVAAATGRPALRDLAPTNLGQRLQAVTLEGGETSFRARLERALEPLGVEAGALIVALNLRPTAERGGRTPSGESPAQAPSRPALKPYRQALRDFDRELFRAALDRTGGHVPAAARLLRLPESTFRYRAGKAGAWRSRASEPKPDP